MDNLIDNSKPALLWATLTIAGTITENINLIGGLVSVGYTIYKIIKDLKKRKKDDKEN